MPWALSFNQPLDITELCVAGVLLKQVRIIDQFT